MDSLEPFNLLAPVKITIYEKDRRRFKAFAAKHGFRTLADAFERVFAEALLSEKPDAAISSEGGEDLGR